MSRNNNLVRFIIGIAMILLIIVKAWISDNAANNKLVTNDISNTSIISDTENLESSEDTLVSTIENLDNSNSSESTDIALTTDPENDSDKKDSITVDSTYRFRNPKLKNQHFDKHGLEMGFANADDYETAASAVVNNPASLHKIEAEDGDDVYYLEATNEFVVVSTDGYLRTYFKPDAGIKYYNKQ